MAGQPKATLTVAQMKKALMQMVRENMEKAEEKTPGFIQKLYETAVKDGNIKP